MHETPIIKDIVEHAQKQGDVKSIVVEVGQLASIEAEHLKEHLKELVDWEIKVEERKAKVKCKCGFEGEPQIMTRGHDFVLFTCPWCGDIPEVIEGADIVLKEIRCV